ncbi:MAG: flagellar motor protein MotB [Fibromonadaceae bacterium]|jgi:chemotaxis protein MotB|nr:flagellar motor protein MotB [Fibromonadaceae bacterium]
MAKKKKCPECPPPGAPGWMASFSDLVTLLLTFFVLLLSMANFDPIRLRAVSESLQQAFGVLESFPTVPIHPIIDLPRRTSDEQRKRQSMKDVEKVKEVVQTKNLEEAVKVEVTDKGMAIMLRDPVGFASGSADLREQGREILRDIGDIIKDNPNLRIRIEGHTDDVPIRSTRFRSNWDLSSARSLSVVELLAEQTGILPQNMSAVGYGEHRPLVPNTSPENRSKNRRIQIFVDYID